MGELTHKYYTWTDGNYMRGQQLLASPQIGNLLAALDTKEEAFATIQDYNVDGTIKGCPLYFDVDSSDLVEAYGMMRDLVDEVSTVLDVTPAVWFSGSKGFHVVAPIYIRHNRCHEIVKMMSVDLGLDQYCDQSVYRTRSMWRCNNTYNKKADRYKVAVDYNDPLVKIVFNSAERIHTPRRGVFKHRDADIASYVSRLPEFTYQVQEEDKDFWNDMSHCMRTLWALDNPPEGYRHQLAHLMSRHCFRSGKSLEEAIALFGGHAFWCNVNERDYTKVLQSVYRSGNAAIGCKAGRDAELLRQYCIPACEFNNETNWKEIFKL